MDCTVMDLEFWGHSVGHCPLNKRGWVLQERLLSPRVLHFGRDQLFWECREHAAAECYPEALPRQLCNGVDAKFKRLHPISIDTGSAPQGGETDDSLFYYKVWNSIIQAYSDTRLTKSPDKLIALSGIAKHMAVRINDKYLVGMWRRYLASSLLWEVDSENQIDGSPSARPQQYRAPSFSWASVDGRIVPAAPSESNLLIKVVEVHIDYVSEDEMGLVKGGYLDLKGYLRPLEIVVKFVGELQQNFIRVHGNIVRASHKQEWDNGPLVRLDIGQKNFDDENKDGSLFYMPTQRQETPDDHVSYLLLLSVKKSPNTFRRIGIAATAEAEEIEVLQGVNFGSAHSAEQFSDHGLQTVRIV
ncbi:putative heterokaryon incompatibility protein [Colletotrichum karsti]|uniref:Heterokaryon incompatibility protein n=1 Tax=Colletotrichum karsti TaxID=1095194 RepID=A0A9P6LE58_9PEZI|nr:putative heterokaryon incompatibility protein [Colletotrichum karsti]KAF9872789.1 putative heterokaryon incompatibility protein [Colletotrichum karsti]